MRALFLLLLGACLLLGKGAVESQKLQELIENAYQNSTTLQALMEHRSALDEE